MTLVVTKQSGRNTVAVAQAIKERLAADFPAVPAYRRGLAASHHDLGILLNAVSAVLCFACLFFVQPIARRR